MSKSFSPARFANPDSAASVRIDLLQKLFKRYVHEFPKDIRSRLSGRAAEKAIQELLTSPAGLPGGLIDDLAVIHELASNRNYDALLEASQRSGVNVPEHPSVGDLVVSVLLDASQEIDRIWAERVRLASRKFVSFFAACGLPPQKIGVSDTETARLSVVIGRELAQRRLGAKARVFAFSDDYGFRLVIRRGDAIARETVLNDDDGEPSSISFRPARFDIVLYDVVNGRLQVNARSQKDRDLYRRAIGDVVFGDSSLFETDGVAAAYELRRLATEECLLLATNDVPGLEHARLSSLTWKQQGAGALRTTWDAPDVLRELKRTRSAIPRGAVLLRARFRLQPKIGKELSVELTPPNSIALSREDARAVVEQWLERRGFMCSREEALHGITRSLLASA